MHQPNFALNKIHSEASIKLLHVSAPGCHHQGVILNKAVQGQHGINNINLKNVHPAFMEQTILRGRFF
jgi:hypothetical protein